MLQPLPKSSTVHAIVVQLGAAADMALPLTLNRAVHAQVMAWLSLGDADIATAVHERQDSPLTISGLLGHRRKGKTQAGDNFSIRIGLLDGDLIHPLLNGLEQWANQPISLANCPLVIRGICSMPGTHPWVGSSSYELLAKLPKASNDLILDFLSPTSFKQQQTIQPFPLPELVFGSLLRRWNTFAPEDLHFSPPVWQGLVSAFDLKTHALKLEGGGEIGAVGQIRYRFAEPEQARIATILAHFAFFSGVGRKTAMGMGQTQLANR